MSEAVPERTMRSRGELTEALAARIVEHITTERLAAGTHVAAQDLADRFNVSRSPINQALRLLHAKGVLAHERNRGYFLRKAGMISAPELGLAVEDELSRVYLQIADDRLHGDFERSVRGGAPRPLAQIQRDLDRTLLARGQDERPRLDRRAAARAVEVLDRGRLGAAVLDRDRADDALVLPHLAECELVRGDDEEVERLCGVLHEGSVSPEGRGVT